MSSAARGIRGTTAPPGVRAIAFAQVMRSALVARVTACKTAGRARRAPQQVVKGLARHPCRD